MTPTARTLARCRANGWIATVVERWNQFSRHRQDLFGFADVLAIQPGGLLAIQATTIGNADARVEKCLDALECRAWLCAGCSVEVWAWDLEDKGYPLLHISRLETDYANSTVLSERWRDNLSRR